MRLIDADALKTHVCDMCDDGQRECKGDESCAILCWVNDMPTIEAEPVRNGRWIEHGGGLVATCSNCNATYRKDVLQSLSPYAEQLTRHCPNCGARMDAIETNTGCKGVDDNDT